MIHIDFETRSIVDLRRTGAYPYANHPTTDINCMGWAIGDGPVSLWNRGDPPPPALLKAVNDGLMIAAWNAQFERLIWNNVLAPRYGFPQLPIERFYCIAALSRARGFPGALDKASRFANSAYRKDMEGHYIMMKLCKPRRIEEDGTIVWWDSPAEYERQGDYCIQDVEVERAMFESFIPFTDEELYDYHLSEYINDNGIHVDLELVNAAINSAESEKLDSADVLTSLTDGHVTSHTQVQKIMEWVAEEWRPLPDLNKSTVQDALLEDDIPPHVADVLEIRLEQARAAVSKYRAIQDRNIDGVVYGMFMFRGAGQTGRYSSVGLQVHNLVSETNLAAIPVLKKRGLSGLRMLGDPVHLLAQMVRPAFVAAPDKTFLIADFAQIEARITAWLAGETELLELFRNKVDTYCAFGTKAFGRTITKADTKLRKISKACVLGLGFGGGKGALARSMKKERIVLSDDELQRLVDFYRSIHVKTKALWYALRDAVLMAMYSRGTIVPVGPVQYLYDGEHLWCRLPSGRLMCYPYARVTADDNGNDCVEYKRGNRSPKAGVSEWPTVKLWYGMLVENLAQAIAFDLLSAALRRAFGRDWCIRLHVHDEIVVEVDAEAAAAKKDEFAALMVETDDWAEGLPVDVEVNISPRYVK